MHIGTSIEMFDDYLMKIAHVLLNMKLSQNLDKNKNKKIRENPRVAKITPFKYFSSTVYC